MLSLYERLNWLDQLYAKKGAFKAAILGSHSNNKTWTDWHTASDKFKENANGREIFPDEIVLDFDDVGASWEDKAANICVELQKHDYNFTIWFTGSKGLHVHLTFPELKNLNEFQRKRARRWFCEGNWTSQQQEFKADLAKKTGLIALEHKPHFKTGRPKVLVIDFSGDNNLPEECKSYAKLRQAPTTIYEKGKSTIASGLILCPFHKFLTGKEDTRPSMKIYPDGMAHCFGCKAHVTHLAVKKQVERNGGAV